MYHVSISGFGFGDNDGDGGNVLLGGSATLNGYTWNPDDVEIDMSVPDGVCSTVPIGLYPDGSDDDDPDDDFVPAPLETSVEVCPDVAAPVPTLQILSLPNTGQPTDVTNSNQTVSVGKILSLQARVLNYTGTPTYQWTQPPGNTGTDWEATADQSQGPVPINPSSLQTSNLFFAWTDTSANAQCATPGHCIQVTATIPGSPPLSAGVQYNITAPNLMPVVQQFGTVISMNCPDQSGILAMCNLISSEESQYGITFQTSPATNAVPPTIEWFQIARAKFDFFSGGAQCEENTFGRDGDSVLPTNNFVAYDGPGVPLANGFQMIAATDTFSTFMMYEPTPSDVWVPLYRIDWTWAAQAQTSTTSPTGWQLSSPSSGGPVPYVVQSSAYPIWTQQIATTGLTCEIVTTPTTPNGSASGSAGTSYAYTTGGSTSNVSNPVQYQFTWGDGTVSPWSSVGTASHSWAGSGTYAVTAQARSAPNPSLLSPTSAALTVVIQ